MTRGWTQWAWVVLLTAAGCTAPSTDAPTQTHAVSVGTRSISTLPSGVEAPAGVLSLWADHAAASNDEIPLYLVNRTDAPIELPAEDGDPYVKLEARTADGRWHRAQRHVFSSCGLSYQPIGLGRRWCYGPGSSTPCRLRSGTTSRSRWGARD